MWNGNRSLIQKYFQEGIQSGTILLIADRTGGLKERISLFSIELHWTRKKSTKPTVIEIYVWFLSPMNTLMNAHTHKKNLSKASWHSDWQYVWPNAQFIVNWPQIEY